MNEFISKYYLYNISDQRMLLSKEADEQTEVASLTKIMTVWVALEAKNRPEKVEITSAMTDGLEEYTIAWLVPGTTIDFSDLIYETLLVSAADAAQAVAIGTYGSLENFVKKMNEKVSSLGLTHTHFSNVVGMDEDNYSSAEDMAVILKNALLNPEFSEAFSTFEKYLPSLDTTVKKTFEPQEVFAGGKTGFTYAAGRNLASTAEINGAKLLLINLNDETYTDTSLELYGYVRENYSYQTIIFADELVANITVEDSRTKNLEFFAPSDVSLLLPNDFQKSNLKCEYNGTELIDNKSNISAHDKLGEYKIALGNETLYTQEILLEEKIEFYPYWLWNTGVAVGFVVFIIIPFIKWRKSYCKRRRA